MGNEDNKLKLFRRINMETKNETPASLPLLNQTVELRALHSCPQTLRMMLEQSLRFYGDRDVEHLETHKARLAIVRALGESIEAEARTLPPVKASQLRDFSQVVVAEIVMDFLTGPQGQKVIAAAVAKVAAKAAADRGSDRRFATRR